MARRYALVLSGGGFKGAYQLGAIKYMVANGIPHSGGIDMDIKFDIIAGVSVGALNGAILAMNKFDQLEALWDAVAKNGHSEIYNSELLSVSDATAGTVIKPDFGAILKKILPSSIFGTIVQGIFATESVIKKIGENFQAIKGLADNDPLLKKLKTLVKKSDFSDTTTYRCGVVSLTDGQYYALGPEDFDTDKDLQLAILSSAAIPIVWPPTPKIKLKDGKTIKNLSDGGIRNVSPLGDVISLIKERAMPGDQWNIIVINCSAQQTTTVNKDFGIADIALRVTDDLMINEIFANDLKEFIKINELVAQVEKGKQAGTITPNFNLTDGGRILQKFNIKVIEPSDLSEVGSTLDSSKKIIQTRFKNGFIKAESVLNAPPTDSLPWA